MDFSRRKFLGAGVLCQEIPLRPPWAQAESLFQEACTRCGDCVRHCPEGILIQDNASSYPSVDFAKGECTFCGDCVDACPSTALQRHEAEPWPYKAKLNHRCLTEQQVVCLSCAEQCEVSAISWQHQAKKVSKPIINIELCTGCGACVASCPTQAIEVKS
ncbi:MAG: ferredoxin-type protein NapF [Mariprofundaceae bacterium]|nr:ferredoxin-type protein NapF [Mariprofundaceae bacterium]